MEIKSELFNMGMQMSTELWSLIYMGVFLLALGLLPLIAKFIQNGLGKIITRKDLPALEGWGDRAERSVRNLYESLPLFTILALIVHFQNYSNETTAMGAIVFCVSRTLHPATYIFNLYPLRTLTYVTAIVGMGMMGSVFF
ncbi:MAPEG family protein [Marinicellulosiphila megalodicopiae]|uniref:MAPEG family protein n=1 Tax=Marinicellulosiphila megalodicopiae TaxID=2724896 RepID=UPI003BB1BDCD